jgi:hypothetical protein
VKKKSALALLAQVNIGVVQEKDGKLPDATKAYEKVFIYLF